MGTVYARDDLLWLAFKGPDGTRVYRVVREELRTALGTVGPQKVEGLLSLAETAKRAGVSPGTVKKWATEGLRVLGAGRMRRFQWPDVVEFLARQAKPAGKAVDPEERAAEILATLPKRKVR